MPPPKKQDAAAAEEGALSPMEQPVPPGGPTDEPAPEDETMQELRARATMLGLTDIEGTGSGGRVTKDDLQAAIDAAPPLTPGRPPLVLVAQQVGAQATATATVEEV
jgi:pyruvate/2-oxoglutarate dehydrogenase complex dihydrolipoamide acyltransferase (E2) component